VKYTFLGTVLSAMVLPGLGQVVCGQVLRGLTLMGLTTIIFLMLLVKLMLMFRAATGAWLFFSGVMFAGPFWKPPEGLNWTFILGWMGRSLDLFFLGLVGGLLGVWLYGVIDGFRQGRLLDRAAAGGPGGGS
jgi:hypothetical protein